MKKIYFLLLLLGLTFGTTYGQINSVALVGEAAGGWPGDPGNPAPIDVHQMSSTNGVDWTLASVTLTTFQAGGGVKFRANNAWLISWGSAAFPTGTGPQGGANINCTAGTYSVTFNSTTGVYAFTAIASVNPTIAIVGSATAQGWPNDPQVDELQLNTSDGITYRSNFAALIAGQLKFRQNNSFAVSWGGVSFPSGPQAGSENDNIVVATPGTYRVVFNKNNGAYTFDFPPVALVGEAVGGWPGDPGNVGPIDANQMTTTDGNVYTVNNLVVTTAVAGASGGAKFRQDNLWITSWGNEAFPSATESNGNNIATTAGTYDVTFTRSTGAYTFVPSLSASNFSKPKVVVFPNPTTSNWHFTIDNDIIKSIRIMDIAGKVIYTSVANSIDCSGYTKGIYFAQIETESTMQTVKLIKQ